MFEWDEKKNADNISKHGVSFQESMRAFGDPNRVILYDAGHSGSEDRYYCVGKVGEGILTVRFTPRNGIIRIIGAGYWRKGKQLYEKRD